MWKSKDTHSSTSGLVPVSGALRHMDIAMSELGQREISGADDNPRVVEYFSATTYHASDDETPWCAAFVNWVLMQAGIARTESAAALSFLKWGKAVSKPAYGDLCVINRGGGRGHVGFFVGYGHNGSIGILGGNQSDEVNVSWFDDKSEIMFRRERKLKDTTTGKIAAATTAALGTTAVANVVSSVNAAATCAKAGASEYVDTAINAGITITQVLSTLPLGGTAELVVGAIGAILVAFERSRKLKIVNV